MILEEESPEMENMSDRSTIAKTSPESEPCTENKLTNSYAVETIIEHESRLTGTDYIVL